LGSYERFSVGVYILTNNNEQALNITIWQLVDYNSGNTTFNAIRITPGLGWCQQREKIDWQETHKFDCQLAWMIFIFFCPSSIFTRRWQVARKSNFDS